MKKSILIIIICFVCSISFAEEIKTYGIVSTVSIEKEQLPIVKAASPLVLRKEIVETKGTPAEYEYITVRIPIKEAIKKK